MRWQLSNVPTYPISSKNNAEPAANPVNIGWQDWLLALLAGSMALLIYGRALTPGFSTSPVRIGSLRAFQIQE